MLGDFEISQHFLVHQGEVYQHLILIKEINARGFWKSFYLLGGKEFPSQYLQALSLYRAFYLLIKVNHPHRTNLAGFSLHRDISTAQLLRIQGPIGKKRLASYLTITYAFRKFVDPRRLGILGELKPDRAANL